MTDKVQKIREWISKEQDGLMDANGNFEYPEHEGAYHILRNLDAYIDSLEEPVNEQNLSYVERTVKNWKEPVSENLGEYINELSKQFPEVSFAKLSRIAVRVAKWQKQKDEKAINENALLYNARLEGIEIGKAEMKQQLMAKAIDAEVKVDAGGYPYIPQMELYDYDKDIPLAKEEDKYKVILIKED